VEGRRAVLELLRAGRRRVHDLWLSSDSAASEVLDEIDRLAAEAGVRVRRVPGDQVDRRARTEAPQGVVAFAAPVAAADVDELLGAPGAFLIALDGVTDPRTWAPSCAAPRRAGPPAWCCRVTARSGSRPRWPRRPPVRSSTCRSRSCPVSRRAGARRPRRGVVRRLDGNGTGSLFELAVADQPLVLVLGAEGRGLSRLARQRCDVIASIPMHGHIESLNVSAAAAVACHEIAVVGRDSLSASPG